MTSFFFLQNKPYLNPKICRFLAFMEPLFLIVRSAVMCVDTVRYCDNK